MENFEIEQSSSQKKSEPEEQPAEQVQKFDSDSLKQFLLCAEVFSGSSPLLHLVIFAVIAASWSLLYT